VQREERTAQKKFWIVQIKPMNYFDPVAALGGLGEEEKKQQERNAGRQIKPFGEKGRK